MADGTPDRLVAAAPSDRRRSNRVAAYCLVAVLAAFAAIAYGPHLGLTFMGDDYVFIDRTRQSSFGQLWSFKNVDFGWYRPWSRELHFWLLGKIAGLHPLAYRCFGVALWLVSLFLYAAVVRRLASGRIAVLATLGVASLALWGTPILWVSGSQDLWMLAFAMATLLLFIKGHRRWALLPFALALLSKETAAVLPFLLCSYLVLMERRSWREALVACGAYCALLVAWLVVHPTLHARLLSHDAGAELAHRLSAPMILLRTMLAMVNLDMLPRTQEVTGPDILRALACAALLAIGATFLARSRPSNVDGSATDPRTTMTFGALWMAIGWIPLFLPSIEWHAYYGCFGALGAWLAIATALRHQPRAAGLVFACLALLRAAQAQTLTWDWGSEAYVRRAGNILSAIRDDLRRQYPTLPPHSRIYFAHIPNNIGLIAGRSPALRVWYADTTLEAGFWSDYRPRSPLAAPGHDLFFRFDSAARMVEVDADREDIGRGQSSDASWAQDHQDLAMVFLRSGDVPRAAREFEKLSEMRERPEAAGFAGVCREAAGDTTRADSLYTAAGTRMGLSPERLRLWITRLRRSFPVTARVAGSRGV